jgi:hypothetical protein
MILNPDANMETIREGVGYQEGEGEQSILQIIPLLLEAGQTTITENLIKVLPASPLKTFYVYFVVFRKQCCTRIKRRRGRRFYNINQC